MSCLIGADTAPPPPALSPLTKVGRQYPGAHCCDGMRDPILVNIAQEYADQMASINSQSYQGKGHFGFDQRRQQVWNTLRMHAVEITAESWSWQVNASGDELGKEMFYCWRRSPGHWSVASRFHKRFGDGLSKSRQGIWFACIIVAD